MRLTLLGASLFALSLHSAASAASQDRTRVSSFPFAGYADARRPVELLIHLPLRDKLQASALSMQLATPGSRNFHRWLTPQQFAQRFAPRPADMLAAASTLRAAGFAVGKLDAQFIRVTAPASTVERFFGTRLGLVRDGPIERLDARVPATVPSSLARLGATVIGLSATPLAPRADRVRPAVSQALVAKRSRLGKPASWIDAQYFPGELLQAYGEPSYTFARGAGIHIATIDYASADDTDVRFFWCVYGLGPSGCGPQLSTGGPSVPFPTVNHFSALGSYPPDSIYADDTVFEEEVLGGSAPGAVIDQYAADAVGNFGFLDMLAYVVASNHDDIVLGGYGGCEQNFIDGIYPMNVLLAIGDVILQGTLQGQTFVSPSGITGAYGCYYQGNQTALSTEAYASNPNVTAVGGTTNLVTTTTDGGTGTIYQSETSHSYTHLIEYASGGGVSTIFATPGFQLAIGLPAGTTASSGPPFGTGRQVPDIAMHMGGPYPEDSDDLLCSTRATGQPLPNCLTYGFGTGFAADEFAGWLAEATTVVNAALGDSGGFRLGNVNNILYYIQAVGGGPIAYNQNIPGDNLYTTYDPSKGLGYNQVIGLGTPNLAGLYGLLGLGVPYRAAGDTFTASNP